MVRGELPQNVITAYTRGQPEDSDVPTVRIFEALLARGKTTRIVTYPGSPHVATLWEQHRGVIGELSAWLARYNP